jgi:Ni,Fe-hydrogenase III large subunit/Ni,Fe-hydrogenase III component G
MNAKTIITKCGIKPDAIETPRADELYASCGCADFAAVCLKLHKRLASPVMMLFAADERHQDGAFGLYCVFEAAAQHQWVIVRTRVPADTPVFPSLAKDVYSASLFEREIYEMFGMRPEGHPDLRRLRLHDEVWPDGSYPLRKDFAAPKGRADGTYQFRKIAGEGVFEVPVGPVHAGIIAPGHFRFSVAGEPVINLETRLGFTHRGMEKLLENRTAAEAFPAVECVSGDSAVAHGLAFAAACEKIGRVDVPKKAHYLRAIALELERMYNHAADVGGIALDVGFSFPSAFASLIKERILAANEQLTGSRYLKGFVKVGGVTKDLGTDERRVLADTLDAVTADFAELQEMLFASASFMDRVDGTGILRKNVAADLGVSGLAARASGIELDVRNDFPGVYRDARIAVARQNGGDVLARLKVRIDEFEESARLVREFAARLDEGGVFNAPEAGAGAGYALGYAEGWRGPVLTWIRMDANGRIDRCKIVDPSFHNWEGLAYALPGNIIPDFPLCNKSFNLSYSGNDL